MEKITVIIPIYNTDIEKLKKSINSVRNQKMKDLKILIVNDGSTDKNIKMICNRFKNIDARIEYIEKENEGCSKTRNLGIFMSQTKYIAFLDPDDYIDENMYLDLYNKIENDRTDVVVCGFYTVALNQKKSESIPRENKNYYYDIGTFGYCVNKLYKTELLKRYNIIFPENTHMNEDLVFNFKYFYYVNKISFIKKSYYFYIKSETGVTNNKYKKKESLISMDEIINFIYSKEDKENWKNIIQTIYRIFIVDQFWFLEELKINKDKYFYEYYSLFLKEMDKHSKKISFINKVIILYRKIRLKFVFIKKLIKRLIYEK